MGRDEDLDLSATHTPPWWRTVNGIVMCGFLLVVGFYLLTKHIAHLWGVLPFLLLLSCPLMHLFLHHGHGKHPATSPPGTGAGPGGA